RGHLGGAVVHGNRLPRGLLHQLSPVPPDLPHLGAGTLPRGYDMTGDARGLLVLAPLSIEARAVRSGLPQARVVTVGMGPRRAERHELAQTGAIAVDMESAWLASAANGHPLAVMRVVSDSPGRDLIAHPLASAVGGVRAYRALARAVPALEVWARATGSRRVL